MRRREAGRGAALAGLARNQAPGRRRSPPGRKLGCPARSWLTTRGPHQTRSRSAGHSGESAVRRTVKTSQVLMLRLSLLHERAWRAERRPPRSQQIADTTGLRFSARHPLSFLAGSARREILCWAQFVSSCPALCRASMNTEFKIWGQGPWIAGTCLREAKLRFGEGRQARQ